MARRCDPHLCYTGLIWASVGPCTHTHRHHTVCTTGNCCLLTVSITEPQACFCPTALSTLSTLWCFGLKKKSQWRHMWCPTSPKLNSDSARLLNHDWTKGNLLFFFHWILLQKIYLGPIPFHPLALPLVFEGYISPWNGVTWGSGWNLPLRIGTALQEAVTLSVVVAKIWHVISSRRCKQTRQRVFPWMSL